MTKFVAGVIVGIFLSVVGANGLLKVADRGVDIVKQQSKELAK